MDRGDDEWVTCFHQICVTGMGYWLGFEYYLILSMFYVWYQVLF